MKKIIFLIALLQAFSNAGAQIVNIPDSIFKSRLFFHGVDLNQDGEIQETEAQQVTFLDIRDSGIKDLTGLEKFTSLHVLNVSGNKIQSIDLTTLKNMGYLYCSEATLYKLELKDLPKLTYLICNKNDNLQKLTIINCPLITKIDCSHGALPTLDLSGSGIDTLKELNCYANELSSVNLTGVTITDFYNFSYNRLRAIDLSGIPPSCHGQLQSNLITFLDFHTSDCSIPIHGNPLEYMIFKDATGSPNLGDFPKLKYLCVKDDKVEYYQERVKLFNYACEVNSYCSINPGGKFYTLEGKTISDKNLNGCDSSDQAFPHLKINISGSTKAGAAFADDSGKYIIPVSSGSHTFFAAIETPAYYSIDPPLIHVDFPGIPDPFIQDFCVTSNGEHNDVQITLLPVTESRPGFNAEFKLIYKNVGTTVLSSDIQLTYEEDVMDFVSTTFDPTQLSPGSISWNYMDLAPFESREIMIKFNLNSPMDIPPLNGGDQLNFNAKIFPVDSDENSSDNTFDLVEHVVNSFDPNDKRCLQGNVLHPDLVGNYIHYMIRFENTGTADAINIVVKDIIDTTRLDISTLIPVDASHDYTTRISGNKAEFFFTNIHLPFDDDNNDGYITFKIKTKETLQINDEIKNKAEIYFDFNFPIITNEEISVIGTLETDRYSPENSAISIIPSLVTDHFTVIGAKQIKSIEIFNSTGKLIALHKSGSPMVVTQSLLAGIYFVRVSVDGGHVVRKLIKG